MNKTTRENSRKQVNRNGSKQPTRVRVQNNGYKDAQQTYGQNG